MTKYRFMQSAAAEPYRVFFPAALLAGVLGVVMWPLFYGGHLSFYPSFGHARMMIEGFVGGFAVGFLGTALPKMLGANTLRVWQFLLLLLLHLSYCTLHFLGKVRVGDALFAAMMCFLIFFLAKRVYARKTLPPPAMVLTGLGLLCGTVGAIWWALFTFQGSIYLTLFFQKLLYQAFILLPLLGVGSFVFPMILGTPNKATMIPSASLNRQWTAKALEAALVGILLVATYWIEVTGQPVMMAWTRFALCSVWLTRECGWLKKGKSGGIMPLALRAGIICLLISFVAAAVMQAQRVAMDHILYISGFGLITMTVATRVIFGHSGQGHQFQRWIKSFAVCMALLLLGMATRVSADFLPHVRNSHHVYAAICWVVVSIIWGIAILPSVRKRPFPTKAPVKKSPSNLMKMDFRK